MGEVAMKVFRVIWMTITLPYRVVTFIVHDVLVGFLRHVLFEVGNLVAFLLYGALIFSGLVVMHGLVMDIALSGMRETSWLFDRDGFVVIAPIAAGLSLVGVRHSLGATLVGTVILYAMARHGFISEMAHFAGWNNGEVIKLVYYAAFAAAAICAIVSRSVSERRPVELHY